MEEYEWKYKRLIHLFQKQQVEVLNRFVRITDLDYERSRHDWKKGPGLFKRKKCGIMSVRATDDACAKDVHK